MQMSNIGNQNKSMLQGAEKEGYRCGICGGLFGKPYLLKSHEQKVHHSQQTEDPNPPQPPLSTMSIVIPAIQTPAMGVAKARGETPFAVLYMIDELPLIVRVMDHGKYNILKVAQSSDFFGSEGGKSFLDETRSVTIAVVAMVHQKIDQYGKRCFEITGPVPSFQKESMPLSSTEESHNVIQRSLSSENMCKTLTQLNAPDYLPFGEASQNASSSSAMPLIEIAEPQPSTSGMNVLKRKINRKTNSTLSRKNPKVIALVNESNQNTPTVESRTYKRNFQNIATGSLLSPVRENNRSNRISVQNFYQMEVEDSLANLNVWDLIQRDDKMLLDSSDILEDIGASNGEI
ncbi:uncharacterized protein LOC129776005 [Toxorhynchites rutilus septentrionalis]|uniref:uncharacterized protein LOC129776005 n=1 Tax=Toxorhynchites rutilus septentrionalis TaxID=329112 RepID=UPI00247A2EFB|nr:uncharacterized protein LOC129776005 [Toxorhynchites rutilus septentrionalis]XP_055637339.1 uncharacterized protein LOC129776005 [Toxorhynchites rutilus septentrionalis]